MPEELRRLYESQTGLEVQSTYFREPGAHVDTSNTVREFVGRLLSEDSGSETIVFHFDFDKLHYAQNSISGKKLDLCENVKMFLNEYHKSIILLRE